MERSGFMGNFKRFFEAYEVMCKPYCKELDISVQAFEILMYIARSEGSATAHGICERQNIKPTLMSFHIEKLVQAGYVERAAMDGNRRSVRLVCTDKAAPVIAKGREINKAFGERIREGISDGEYASMQSTLAKINANAERIINGND